jgi:mannose-6-phosphate isomerase-like protein (cupin superfamily)
MQTFPRKPKPTPGAYYFGEFDEAPRPPFSISVATFDNSFTGESIHYHSKVQKIYLTLRGKGLLEVDGKTVELRPEQLVHVEPNEKHRLLKVLEAPFEFVAITSEKINDKVIVEENEQP